MTNREAYITVRNQLMAAGFAEAEAEAREVVCHFEKCDYSQMRMVFDHEACFDAEEIIEKRLSHMPLAYILNEKYFYSLPFYVDSSVLIPRYDTEILVYEAVLRIKKHGLENVLDMCCGSGCVGIAITRNTGCNVLLADNSDGALAVTERNIEKLLCRNATAVKSDYFENIDGQFDMIVCNPPYVTEEEYAELEPQVRDFEPECALLGGTGNYRRIAQEARGHLKDGGYLLCEIGCTQRMAVENILLENGYGNIMTEKDLSDLDRVVICTKN